MNASLTKDQVLTITFTILWTFYAHMKACRHVYYLSQHQKELAMKINWITHPFCTLSVGMGKVSVTLLTFRFGPRDKLRRGLLYFSAISITVLLVVECIFAFTQCDPPSALWTFNVKANCRPEKEIIIMWMTGSS